MNTLIYTFRVTNLVDFVYPEVADFSNNITNY
jgi:hypothetical protein